MPSSLMRCRGARLQPSAAGDQQAKSRAAKQGGGGRFRHHGNAADEQPLVARAGAGKVLALGRPRGLRIGSIKHKGIRTRRAEVVLEGQCQDVRTGIDVERVWGRIRIYTTYTKSKCRGRVGEADEGGAPVKPVSVL